MISTNVKHSVLKIVKNHRTAEAAILYSISGIMVLTNQGTNRNLV